jgi:hypothetical protein
MGKYYEDLDTLNQLVKKLQKKNELSEFIIRVVRYAKENSEKSVSDIIKEIKKGRGLDHPNFPYYYKIG